MNDVVATTGTDPALDALIMRIHTETACHKEGALALRPCDLNQTDCTVQLQEKGDITFTQPVSPTLMRALIQHTAQRNPHGSPTDKFLRHRTGRALDGQRYTALFRRLGRQLPWVANLGVTSHWLRYTTLT